MDSEQSPADPLPYSLSPAREKDRQRRLPHHRRTPRERHGHRRFAFNPLAARDEDGSQMTDRQLRDEVMTLFLAGHETTALTLAWSWYLLGKDTDIAEKFHAELDEVLGNRDPAFADLPRLKYTEKIAKESMRLYPPAYGLGREAIDDCEIGGYRVPAGTQVFMFQWATQRDARFFDEPRAFKPERWTEEFESQLPKYAYFPFGGGPRACVGASFGLPD